jgi:hypothetical protein
MERICNNSKELEYIMVTKEQKEAINKNNFLLSKVNKDGSIIFNPKNQIEKSGILNKDGSIFRLGDEFLFNRIIRFVDGYTFLKNDYSCYILNKHNVPFKYKGISCFFEIGFIFNSVEEDFLRIHIYLSKEDYKSEKCFVIDKKELKF